MLINHLPHVALSGQSPRTVFSHRPSNVLKFKAFGCLAYVRNEGAGKLEDKARTCLHLGVDPLRNQWLFYDIDDHVIFPGRDATFFETEFPFSPNYNPDIPQSHQSEDSSVPVLMPEYEEDIDEDDQSLVASEPVSVEPKADAVPLAAHAPPVAPPASTDTPPSDAPFFLESDLT